MMQDRNAFFLFLISFGCLQGIVRCLAQHTEAADWDYFVYAQQWPPAVCLQGTDMGNSYEHHCTIPEIVNTWTVHGLWPSKKGLHKPGPNFCNNSAKFDESKIKPIEHQLEQYWPNLFTDEPLTSFWKHEWEKHGTCAMTLPATYGEMNYFSMGLKLNKIFNLTRILNIAGYNASDTTPHKVSDLYEAVNDSLHGKPYLECVNDKEKVFLGQLEICTDKQFNVIDCEHTNHQQGNNVLYFVSGHSGEIRPCKLDEKVYWPEMRHTKYFN